MPELLLMRGDGRLADDALALLFSTMHFPSPKDENKRALLADLYRAQKILAQKDPDYPAEGELQHSLTASEIALLRRGRDLSELVPDQKKQFRDGFLAGHWLTFRVYASRFDPQLNSTNRWLDYALAFLMPSLPSEGWTWLVDSKKLRAILKKYGSVAHLWAAATYDHHFRSYLLHQRRIDFVPKLAWSVMTGHSVYQLVRQAQGYYQAAVEGGLFIDKRSSVQLEDVWTLPPSIPASPVAVDHPDHLLELDFQILKQGYVTRANASAETRVERSEQAKDVVRLAQAPKNPLEIEEDNRVAPAPIKPLLIRNPVPPARTR